MNNKIIVIIVFVLILLAITLVLVLSGTINLNPTIAPKCIVAGCSGELCVDENDASAPRVSICIWSNKFACYKQTVCEAQSNGKCGWTPNENFNRCLEETDNTIDQIAY